MNYLYFAEILVETGGATNPEALLLPADSYLGADPASTTTTTFYFKSVDGIPTTREAITITHATTANGGGFKRMVRAMTLALNANYPSNDGFIVFADQESGTATTKTGGKEYTQLLNGLTVTTVAIA